MGHTPRKACFFTQPLHAFRRWCRRIEEFHRDHFSELEIQRAIHHPHAAVAEGAHEPIPTGD